METTLSKKPIITQGNLLTDNSEESVDYKNALTSIKQLISFEIEKEHTVNEETPVKRKLDNDYSNKIRALQRSNPSKPAIYYNQTQNWIGHVIEIHEDNFVARLDDYSEPGTYEIAEFEVKEVNYEDRKLINIGSIFYWSVGFAVKGSQIYKESFIRFQRLPSWDVDEFDSVMDKSRKLRAGLKWE